MITQEQLKELLHYNPETGVFTWLPRSIGMFESERIMKSWNTKYALSLAGYRSIKINGRYRYVIICIDNKLYRAHRLAWLYLHGSFPADQIDHINGNGLDNRILNLRSVTCSENNKNQRIPKNNTSGVMGVRWHKHNSKWFAEIRINRKHIHLGSYDYWFEALCARKSAENRLGFHENHGSR